MSRMGEWFGKVGAFLTEVSLEMKKTDWPGRQELVESTIVVVASLFLLAFYVGLCDKLFVLLLKTVMR